ncbi:uncharacterized protein [Montipora capricornis]|uniref:uncharacterized protein n=1 Tax=Montipora capricornis TaxID=246305 RepID=UPI0035F18A90
MATGRAAASQTQKSEATTKKSSNNRKTVDWTREETEELLQAWGPKFEELKKVSTKERGRIWSEIYNKYKERFTKSVRTLPQLKKRIQNLEYEFKNLKVRVKNTGEEGFKKIKQGFPYYDYLDTIIGQRDSVDPSRMQIESTATFSCSSSDSSETSLSRSSESKEVQSAVENRKMCEKSGKSSRKVKRRREDSDSDWQERFENMWERSLEQEREGRESTQQIIRESLRSEMEQTNAIMAGFKDIFENLLK